MTQLEDAVRRALRARASEVRPPLPPLELRPTQVSGPVGRIGSYRLWRSAQLRWLAPAATVITVLALVASALLARADLATKTPPVAQIQTSVPRYYVALTADSGLGRLDPATYLQKANTVATVRETMTSAVLARIRPPVPYLNFVAVSGATDDRTFVLLAEGSPSHHFDIGQEAFFLLRISPSTPGISRAQLMPLPTAVVSSGAEVNEMALSPSGADLAVVVTSFNAHGFATTTLRVDNLLTGTTRAWTRAACNGPPEPACNEENELTGPGGLFPGSPISLSWLSSGTALALNEYGASAAERLLDLNARGDYVQPNSALFPIHGVPVAMWTADMTPSGRTIYISYVESKGGYQNGWSWAGLLRYSVATRKLSVVNKLTIQEPGRYGDNSYPTNDVLGPDDVLWTSYSGDLVIVADCRPGQTACVYHGSTYSPIPWPANVIDAAW